MSQSDGWGKTSWHTLRFYFFVDSSFVAEGHIRALYNKDSYIFRVLGNLKGRERF